MGLVRTFLPTAGNQWPPRRRTSRATDGSDREPHAIRRGGADEDGHVAKDDHHDLRQSSVIREVRTSYCMGVYF